jgi:hypothetical protein
MLAQLPMETVVRIIEFSLTPSEYYAEWSDGYDNNDAEWGDEYDDDDMNFDVTGYYKCLQAISSICRRTRDIVRSTRAFWTFIDYDLHPRLVRTCLERSNNAGLTISMIYRGSDKRGALRFLNEVIPHCRRWRSVSMIFRRKIEGHYTQAHLLRDLQTDTLSFLKWQLPIPWYYLDLHEEIDELHSYTTWSAPLLQHFTGNGTVPPTFQPYFNEVGPRLTVCRLRYYGLRWGPPLKPLKRLTDFLSSQPSLVELEISLDHFPIENDFSLEAPVVMPQLRRFAIEAYCTSSAVIRACAFVVQHFLRCLAIPAIEDLSMAIPFRSRELTVEAGILPPFNEYRLLTCLYINVTYFGDRRYQLSLFKHLFRRLPSLQYLAVVAEETELAEDIFSESPGLCPPPLRELELVRCTMMSPAFLLNIIRFLSTAESWEGFDMLRILSCPGLQECREDLLTLLPEDKVEILLEE